MIEPKSSELEMLVHRKSMLKSIIKLGQVLGTTALTVVTPFMQTNI